MFFPPITLCSAAAYDGAINIPLRRGPARRATRVSAVRSLCPRRTTWCKRRRRTPIIINTRAALRLHESDFIVPPHVTAWIQHDGADCVSSDWPARPSIVRGRTQRRCRRSYAIHVKIVHVRRTCTRRVAK